jgi:PilZ domain
MGKRIEPRLDVQVPVRIFGTDRSGAVFSQKVVTVNISRLGVELAEVEVNLAADEMIGLSYGNNRMHFRVKWVGAPDTPKAGHVGLLSTAPEKQLWDFPLPAPASDNHRPGLIEKRKHARFRCQNAVEIHIENGTSFWGTVADLSLGGCYVEMPIPLQPGTKLKVGIWIGQTKVMAESAVAHRTPGLGVGIRFNQISNEDLDAISLFLSKLAPFARKPFLRATP